MNKYSLITSVAIIVIIIPVLYGVWNIYSVEQFLSIHPLTLASERAKVQWLTDQ